MWTSTNYADWFLGFVFDLDVDFFVDLRGGLVKSQLRTKSETAIKRSSLMRSR